VLMLAGAGDELQWIKKGVLELAHAIAITKADGNNIEKAKQAARAYASALHLLSPASANWQPPVLTCSALSLEGVDTVWETVLTHRQRMQDSGEFEIKRRGQALDWLQALLDEGLRERFQRHPEIARQLPRCQRAVAKGETSPTVAANELLFFLDNPKPL